MLEKVREICGESAISPVMEYVFENAIWIVKNYCHIYDIPEGLETVVIDMVSDMLMSGEYADEYGTGKLKSITEGDIAMTFDQNFGEKYGLKDIKSYENRMRNFRRVKW